MYILNFFSHGISRQVEQHLVLKFNLIKIARYGAIVVLKLTGPEGIQIRLL